MKGIVALAMLFTLGAYGQDAPRPCSDAGHAQFDFWVGEWRVTTRDGKHAGDNTITRIHGCALREEWRGARGSTGSSLNIYDATTKRWHQTWVDSGGTLLLLDGAFENGAMRMTGTRTDAQGRKIRDRITWTPIDEKHVRQLWEQATGESETWTVAFDGLYQRR